MTYQKLYKEKLLQNIINRLDGYVFNNFTAEFNKFGGVIEWCNNLEVVYATPHHDDFGGIPISIEEIGSPIRKDTFAPFELTYSDIDLDTKKYFDIMDIVLTDFKKLGN